MNAHVTVWPSKSGKVTLYLSGAGLTSSLELTAEQAKRLASDLTREVDNLPRVVTADDLGLEAA